MKLMSRAATAALMCALVVESAGFYISPLSVAAYGGPAPHDLTAAEATELPPDPAPVTDSPTSIESASLPRPVEIVASEVSVTLTDASARALDAGVDGQPIISASLVPADDTKPVDVTTSPTETSATESDETTTTSAETEESTPTVESTAPTTATTTPPADTTGVCQISGVADLV